MASARELYLILRGRDEASRVVGSFARNVRSAGLAARAAQLQARSAAIRQQAQVIKTSSALRQQIDVIDAATLGLDRNARHYSLAAAQARQYRDSLRSIGASTVQIQAAHHAVQQLQHQAAIFARQASINRNASARLRHELNQQIRVLNAQANALDAQANRLLIATANTRRWERRLRILRGVMSGTAGAAVGLGIAFGAASVAGGLMLNSFIRTAAEYERQVHHTRTQVDGLKYSFDEIAGVGRRIAGEIGVSFEQIQPALFDIFSSMEVGIKDAEILLKAFSKGAIAGQTDIQAVSRATIGLMNAFRVPARDVNRILDLQFELVQEGIGTYEEWNTRLGLVTPSAVRAGQSIEMMVAALATSTRMGISAARSGTAVARAFDAMSHPSSVKKLENMGVKVRDVAGNMRPLNLVLGEFRDKLMKLPVKKRLEAILDVFKGAGGTIEARRFLQNVLLGANGLETFNTILKATEDSAGNMERAYETMANTTAVKSELLRNQWMLIKESIGAALLPSFNSLLEKLIQLGEWFNELPESTKKTIGQFIVWGSAISAVVASIMFLVAVMAGFVLLITSAGVALVAVGAILGGAILAFGAFAAAVKFAWDKSENFRDLLNNLKQNIETLTAIVKNTAAKIKESWNDHVVPAFEKLGEAIEDEVLPVLEELRSDLMDKVIPAAQDVADFIKYLTDVVFYQFQLMIEEKVVPALEELSDWYNRNKKEIDLLMAAIVDLTKFMVILALVLGSAGVVTALKLFGSSLEATIILVTWLTDATRWLWASTGNLIEKIKEWAKGSGDAANTIKNAMGTIVTAFGNVRNTAIAVANRIATAFNFIRAAITTAMKTAISNVITQFNQLQPGAVKAIQRAASAFGALPRLISGALGNLGGLLFGAGQRVIDGFINGIRSKVSALAGTLSAITRMIPNVKGPKARDLKLLRPSGQFVMEGFERGIKDMVPGLKSTLNDITSIVGAQTFANRIAPTFGNGPTANGSVGVAAGANGASTNIDQKITIYTNEIDPRLHAQKLGFELLSRM